MLIKKTQEHDYFMRQLKVQMHQILDVSLDSFGLIKTNKKNNK